MNRLSVANNFRVMLDKTPSMRDNLALLRSNLSPVPGKPTSMR